MPIERPHVGRFGPFDVVLVHVETPRAAIQNAMRAALHEITTALEAQHVAPAGAWFAHHHRRPTDTFSFDVCFPVTQPLALSGNLQHALVPETEVVRTAYHGPYEGLPEAWPEFRSWIHSHGHKTRGDAFEVYSIEPREHPEPEAWQTDLLYPLVQGTAGRERVA